MFTTNVNGYQNAFLENLPEMHNDLNAFILKIAWVNLKIYS